MLFTKALKKIASFFGFGIEPEPVRLSLCGGYIPVSKDEELEAPQSPMKLEINSETATATQVALQPESELKPSILYYNTELKKLGELYSPDGISWYLDTHEELIPLGEAIAKGWKCDTNNSIGIQPIKLIDVFYVNQKGERGYLSSPDGRKWFVTVGNTGYSLSDEWMPEDTILPESVRAEKVCYFKNGRLKQYTLEDITRSGCYEWGNQLLVKGSSNNKTKSIEVATYKDFVDGERFFSENCYMLFTENKKTKSSYVEIAYSNIDESEENVRYYANHLVEVTQTNDLKKKTLHCEFSNSNEKCDIQFDGTEYLKLDMEYSKVFFGSVLSFEIQSSRTENTQNYSLENETYVKALYFETYLGDFLLDVEFKAENRKDNTGLSSSIQPKLVNEEDLSEVLGMELSEITEFFRETDFSDITRVKEFGQDIGIEDSDMDLALGIFKKPTKSNYKRLIK